MSHAAAVSVIVTVYNNASTIGEALDSILSQTRPPDEVVVIDDGSTDGSGDAARSFGRAVRVIKQSNQGVSAARNRGVAESKGDLLAALDADDGWAPTKLERQLPLLGDDVDAVSCHVAQVFEQDWLAVSSGQQQPRTVMRGPVWESLLIRRSSFERVGRFDPTYVLAEQVDWWTRAADAGLRVVTVEEPLVFRRLHADNHGLRQWDRRAEYAQAIHAALRRRRAMAQPAEEK